ncbi:hypothetical protein M1146_07335 [Patescibacteria group bacterium]|nr:hypothetical protein [Patescibacteria group bacterium]
MGRVPEASVDIPTQLKFWGSKDVSKIECGVSNFFLFFFAKELNEIF